MKMNFDILAGQTIAAAMLLAAVTVGADVKAQNTQSSAKSAYLMALPTDALKRMNPVDKLVAIEEIKQLPLRYGRCISQKDWACVRGVFTPDFTMNGRLMGPEGFINVMHLAGTYDRVATVLHMHGMEIEILSPTTARGIVAADFAFFYPPGSPLQPSGKEVVQPGQQTHTDTYYYQTYTRIDGAWKIRTLDHVSFDLRTDVSATTKVFERAYTTPDGVPPVKQEVDKDPVRQQK